MIRRRCRGAREDNGLNLIRHAYRDVADVELPGGPVAVVRRGQGRPVVLLHGVPLSLLTWRHTVDELARAADVVALDLRGFGKSAKPPGSYRVDDHATVVEDLIAALNLPPAILVGSSYGGAVAVTVASRSPEKVAGLVLVNPVCYPGGRHSAERVVRLGFAAALARGALGASPLGRMIIAKGLRRSYVDRCLVTPELVDSYHALLERDGGVRAFIATLRQLSLSEVSRCLPNVRSDVLVLWGKRDRVLPIEHASRLAQDLPNSSLTVLSDAGHLPHEEMPDRTNPLIADFIAGSRRPRAGFSAAREAVSIPRSDVRWR